MMFQEIQISFTSKQRTAFIPQGKRGHGHESDMPGEMDHHAL